MSSPLKNSPDAFNERFAANSEWGGIDQINRYNRLKSMLSQNDKQRFCHFGYYYIFFERFDASKRVIDKPGSKFHQKTYGDKIQYERIRGMPYQYKVEDILEYIVQHKDIESEEYIEALEVLKLEYKIHLMVKPEYVESVTEFLLEKMVSDPKLNEVLTSFKVKIDPHLNRLSGGEDQHRENLPTMVLYPTFGQRSAQKLLDILARYFSAEDCEEMGLDLAPRFNDKFNPMIFWAQGAGDFKENIKYYKHGSDVADINNPFKTDFVAFRDGRPMDDPYLDGPTLSPHNFVDPLEAPTVFALNIPVIQEPVENDELNMMIKRMDEGISKIESIVNPTSGQLEKLRSNRMIDNSLKEARRAIETFKRSDLAKRILDIVLKYSPDHKLARLERDKLV